jgi:hypothetical protein
VPAGTNCWTTSPSSPLSKWNRTRDNENSHRYHLNVDQLEELQKNGTLKMLLQNVKQWNR